MVTVSGYFFLYNFSSYIISYFIYIVYPLTAQAKDSKEGCSFSVQIISKGGIMNIGVKENCLKNISYIITIFSISLSL